MTFSDHLDDNVPITLQTDAFDFGIGGYLFQTVDGLLQVIMCIRKAFIGAQLRWSISEKEYFAVFYCLKVLENMLNMCPSILKQITITLCTSTAPLQAKLEGLEEYQQVPDMLSRLVSNPK